MKYIQFLLLILCILQVECRPKSTEFENLKGSWFYLYDDIYFELYITNDHLIYQSEVMGIQIKYYKETGGKLLVFNGENDINPTYIKVLNLEKKYASIEQDSHILKLTRLNIKTIDLEKLLEVNSSYYKTFMNSFNKRKATIEK